MKKAFEAVMQKYEDTKKAIKEKWEARFNGKKNELSQDILKAGTPDELLAVAEKIKNEAEAMKAEQDAIKQEDAQEDAAYEDKKKAETNRAHDEVFEGHDKYEEASEMNRAFDENRAAEEAALEEAKIAAEEKKIAEEDAAKRAAILAEINGVGVENSETVAAENQESSSQEELIEKIGAPKSETFEKYGNGMREAADELVLVVKEMRTKSEEMRSLEKEYSDAKGADAKSDVERRYNKLRDERDALNDRRNELSDNASWGSNVIGRQSQKAGESYNEFSDRVTKEHKKYREAAMSDPYVVLKMIEAGELGGDANGSGLGKVSEKFLSNPEFIAEAIKLCKKYTKQGSYDGYFWSNVSGEARANKDLFIEAVKLNHLNYQHGSPEMKSDPEVQKVALQSGLDPSYL